MVAMLRLRVVSPLPDPWPIGVAVRVELALITERGKFVPWAPAASATVKVQCVDQHLNRSQLRMKVDPPRPKVTEAAGLAQFKVTLTAGHPLQLACLRFDVVPKSKPMLEGGGSAKTKKGAKSKSVKGGAVQVVTDPSDLQHHPLSGCNLTTPAFVLASSGTGVGTPKDTASLDAPVPMWARARTAFEFDGIRLVCCEYSQLLDPDEAGHGTVVWDSGAVLAAHLAGTYGLSAQARLKGSTVLGIGSGPALPEITAACLGAQVLLTDIHPITRNVCAPNIEANRRTIDARRLGGSAAVTELRWGVDPVLPEFPRWKQPDLVICADIVYDESLFEPLAHTLAALLPPPPTAVTETLPKRKHAHKLKKGAPADRRSRSPHALFAYRERTLCARHGCDTDAFWELLRSRGFAVELVELFGNAAILAARAQRVTIKASQRVAICRVTRLPILPPSAKPSVGLG